MAATFVVEDGTGLSNANSYISVADADTYNDNHNADSSWVDGSATGSLHIAVQPTDTDTVVVDTKTYTFQTSLTDVDGNVKIGSTLAFSQANLQAAINLNIDQAEDASSYADAMTLHTTVSAGTIASNVIPMTAKTAGIAGNTIATTTGFTDELNHFEEATLLGALAEKEKHLRLATQYLDTHYGKRWRGHKGLATQALDHPRVNIEDDDGFFRDSDEVAQEVLDATVEAAIRSKTSTLNPDLANSGTIQRKKIKADVIEQDITYMGGSSPNKKYTVIDDIIRPVLIDQDKLFRS